MYTRFAATTTTSKGNEASKRTMHACIRPSMKHSFETNSAKCMGMLTAWQQLAPLQEPAGPNDLGPQGLAWRELVSWWS